jgi:hypothetical protein
MNWTSEKQSTLNDFFSWGKYEYFRKNQKE